MEDHLDPEEIRHAKITAMGEELGVLHFELGCELGYLHSVWNEYQELYVNSSAAVQVLNLAAPRHFFYAQKMFYDGILLHLCRLTDPVTIGENNNTTVQRIPALIHDKEFQKKIKALVDQAVLSTEFAREQRQRPNAHQYYFFALNEQARPLTMAGIAGIVDAMIALVHCLNEVEYLFQGSTTTYDVPDAPGDARSLLHILEKGLQRRDLLKEEHGL